MANKKPQYQPWNEEEFQSDVFVRGMTPLQRWMYRTLLQASFFHTTRPYLPKDDRVLWILAGCENRQQWEDNKTEILERFTAVEIEGVQLLENKRVTNDWNKLQDFREKMADLGSKGGEIAAAKRKTSVLLTGSQAHAIPSATASDAAHAIAREDKTSEVKEEVKVQSQESVTDGGAFSSETPQQAHGSDWKNIAVRHKRLFGTQASTTFKTQYAEACNTYGEDVVLECFNDWAQDAKDWVKSQAVKQPLFAFWKKLPEMAVVVVAVKEEEQQQARAAVVAAAAQQQREKEIDASVKQQARADWEFMTQKPAPQNEGDMLEYLAEVENSNAASNPSPDSNLEAQPADTASAPPETDS